MNKIHAIVQTSIDKLREGSFDEKNIIIKYNNNWISIIITFKNNKPTIIIKSDKGVFPISEICEFCHFYINSEVDVTNEDLIISEDEEVRIVFLTVKPTIDYDLEYC